MVLEFLEFWEVVSNNYYGEEWRWLVFWKLNNKVKEMGFKCVVELGEWV